MDKRRRWDDEDDDWNQPRRPLRPDQVPPAKSGWRPSIVEWMYVVFGVLIVVQLVRFHLD